MNCPRCGQILPGVAAFCMHCGQAIPKPESAVQGRPTPNVIHASQPIPRKKNYTGLAVLLSFLLVTGVAFGLFKAGVLQLPGTAPENDFLRAQGSMPPKRILTAEGSQPSPDILTARGANPDNVISADRRDKMPADIRRWLEHLERIERERASMTTRQISGAIASMMALQMGGGLGDLSGILDGSLEDGVAPQETIDSAQQATKSFESNQREWADLNQQFISVSAPSECLSLRNEYDKTLRETGLMISEILRAVEDASSDRTVAIQKLLQLQSESQQRISKPARQSDQYLGDICRKYETSKWFEIADDFGKGSMMGLGIR